MLYITQLRGRPVIDLETASKLGTVAEVLLDPDRRRIAGLDVSHGSSLLGGGSRELVPASSIEAFGDDAITVRRGAAAPASEQPEGLLPFSKLAGRKVVSFGGRLLGTIDDVAVEAASGRITGYTLRTDAASPLGALFSGPRPAKPQLRADAGLRFGDELVVAPEDAIVGGEPADDFEPKRSVADEPAANRRSDAMPMPPASGDQDPQRYS